MNPHPFRNTILSRARLPFRHSGNIIFTLLIHMITLSHIILPRLLTGAGHGYFSAEKFLDPDSLASARSVPLLLQAFAIEHLLEISENLSKGLAR